MTWKTTQKDVLDRFYTHSDVAQGCVEAFISNYGRNHTFIEPSAGSGVFVEALRKFQCECVGYDIEPEHPEVIRQDTLLLTLTKRKDYVVIGNPPYGKNGELIKRFTDWCVDNDVATIAFILPKTYLKASRQKSIPRQYKLLLSKPLKEFAFSINGKPYHVPAVFQVWSKSITGKDLRNNGEVPENNLFTFCKKDVADGYIMGAAPSKVKLPDEVLPNNRGYWIKLKEGVDMGDVKAIMESIKWKHLGLSSVSGGVSWYDKQQISKVVNQHEQQHFSNQL